MMEGPDTVVSAPVAPSNLVLEGQTFDHIVADKARLTTALESFGINATKGPPKYIKRLIQAIRDADKANTPIAGFGGINWTFAQALLDNGEDKLHPNTEEFDPAASVSAIVTGKITGYEYKPGNRSGYMEAITYIHRNTARGGTAKPKTDAYRWKISIAAGGYIVIPHSGDRNIPFRDPNDPTKPVLPFSAQALNEIEVRGFTHKLWAKGTKIEVLSVDQDKNHKPHKPKWKLLNKTSHTNLYLMTPDSCIDMMFKIPAGGKVPETMTDLLAYVAGGRLPGYCLGRCGHPFIVNTGF